MSDGFHFTLSEITDAEIRRASCLLGLDGNAFHGEDNADPRQEVLKSVEQMDIAACPGSGKTTLLVAKLAILADKWRYRTRGICVLSHTNAARREIETKLGNTTAGQRLLSYPHFIGTIHRLVDEFLAIPWLRSCGYQIKMIDTDVCQKRRWKALPRGTRGGLETNGHGPSILSVKSTNFDVGTICWGKKRTPLRPDTDTYTRIRDVCQQSSVEGYFCYDEMFVWARNLLDKVPSVVEMLRDRFPILFIDEAQDNSEDQSAILHRIFVGGGRAVIRQRFGDANQAIFNSVGEKGAENDKFPDEQIKKDLPNSHRFGQTIADLADPFGLVPCGLKGQGPMEKFLASGAQEGRHTIFLFDPGSATKVLDAYGQLLLETFSDQELRDRTFCAVGQVHRPPEKEEDHKFPQHIGHYWPDYNPELSKQDPKPESFVQYVLVGMAKAKMTGEASPAVEKIAEGILRLAGMAEGGIALHQRRHSHRCVLQLLEEHTKARKRYDAILDRFILRRDAPTKEMWNDDRRRIVKEIAEIIAKASLSGSEVEEFLAWPDEPDAPALPAAARKERDNIYRFPKDGREVAIQIGSIHSVKGKTNTSTLVLETYWYDHNLESIKNWLSNDPRGGEGQNDRLQSRLKLQYVAMTRPTHLLCLAMKRSAFEKNDGSLDEDVVQKLKDYGWCEIKCV